MQRAISSRTTRLFSQGPPGVHEIDDPVGQPHEWGEFDGSFTSITSAWRPVASK